MDLLWAMYRARKGFAVTGNGTKPNAHERKLDEQPRTRWVYHADATERLWVQEAEASL